MNNSTLCIIRGMLNDLGGKKSAEKAVPQGTVRDGGLNRVHLRYIVPIAYGSSANRCYLQKPGSKKKIGLLVLQFSNFIIWDFFCISEFWFHRLGSLIGTYLSSSLVPSSSPPLCLTCTAEVEISDNGSTGTA